MFSTKKIIAGGLFALSMGFNGCLTESKDPVPTSDIVTSANITLGSWSSPSPSYLDADSMMAFGGTAAGLRPATIDVCFFNEAGGGVFFMSPLIAAGQLQAPQNWTPQNATLFHSVTASFDAITSQAGIDSLWNAANALGRVAVTTNGVYVVNTNLGNKVLVNVVGTPGSGDAATVVIKGKY